MKQHFLFVICLLITMHSLSISETPTDAQLKLVAQGLIESLNTNDIDQRTTFLKAHYINSDSIAAIDRWQGHLRRYAQDLGHVEIHNIDISNPASLHILLRTSNQRVINQWTDLEINMDSEKKDKFRTLHMNPGQDPSIVLPDRSLTTDEIATYIKNYIDDLVARDVFSGTVLLVKDDKQFFSGAYGKANLRWDIDNNLETKFNLGSMNKMFTGIAICQLVADGNISFDDPIGKHLTDYPNKKAADNVTIHHLLTHTSGMGSYWEAMISMDWTYLKSIQEFANLGIKDSLLFEPGDNYQYSNTGPLVLGLIIEKVTGMDYHDYIRKFVTEPAGMINTDCYSGEDIIPNLALGYYWSFEINAFRSNIFEHSSRGSASGGGYSTVIDLQKFVKALFNGTLLSPEMLKIYTTGKVDIAPDAKYAYLIRDNLVNGHRMIGHNGGAPGINAALKIFSNIGFSVATMSNYDEAANSISNYAAQLITHKRPVPNE